MTTRSQKWGVSSNFRPMSCGQTARSIKMPLGMEVGLSPGDCVRWRPSSPLQKGHTPSFRPMSIVAKLLMFQDNTWYGCRPQPSRHCVWWGPSSPPLKGHSPFPNFRPVRCGETAEWTKMPLGMEVGLSPGDCVRWGPSSPRKKGAAPTQFSAHVYCGQTAGCINMPLGMEVGLSPSDFVLDWDPPPHQKGVEPQFTAHVHCGQRLHGSRYNLVRRWA